MTHLSDSAVQRHAEEQIVGGLAAELGVALSLGARIDVGGGAHVSVDARDEAGTILVEAYARQGKLKGAQLKKVSQDILKFALLRRMDAWSKSRMILVFASTEAKDSIRGWAARAAHEFQVELIDVAISKSVADDILEAQKRQVMVNMSPDEAAAISE